MLGSSILIAARVTIKDTVTRIPQMHARSPIILGSKESDNGTIVIVAGFQGVDMNENITTLGRGGSDTTAIALAAIMKADRCDIFTDGDGIYTADPRKVLYARNSRNILLTKKFWKV